ncbi:MAG: GntR family transcriptional regulator [Acidobacteria bacterium]|nr:GntR family transcriptional regulator [Acidobacteriota bacterium]MDW7983343.1 GntR family transcriptional regulator [Acidobacteriota bacterium]
MGRLERKTLAWQIAELIQQWILRQELRPGQPIKELHIAQKLAISQTPVREALRILEQRGLVVHIPHRGTVVTDLSEEDIRQVLAVRRPLEVLALQLAHQYATPADEPELQDLLDRLVTAGEKGDLLEYHEVHAAFHRRVWSLSRNRYLVDTLERLCLPLWAFYRQRLYMGREPQLFGKGPKHRLVLDFIFGRCGPDVTAEQVIDLHFQHVHTMPDSPEVAEFGSS